MYLTLYVLKVYYIKCNYFEFEGHNLENSIHFFYSKHKQNYNSTSKRTYLIFSLLLLQSYFKFYLSKAPSILSCITKLPKWTRGVKYHSLSSNCSQNRSHRAYFASLDRGLYYFVIYYKKSLLLFDYRHYLARNFLELWA